MGQRLARRQSYDIDLDVFGSPKMRSAPLPLLNGHMPQERMMPRAVRRAERALARRARQDIESIRKESSQRSRKAS